MRKFLWPTLMSLAMLWTFASVAAADTLTLTDAFNDVWTLDVQTSCTSNCTVTLTGDFTNTTATGDYIDAVQWVVTGGDPTSVSLTSTTAPGDWNSAQIDTSLSGGNQCNGGETNAVCDQTASQTAADMAGPISSSDTWVWTFSVDWASALPDDLTTGNIRVAYDDSTGQNVYTFSPDFGNFTTGVETTTTGEQTTGTVPEPGLLLLFGTGLTAAATRLRRRQRRSSESA